MDRWDTWVLRHAGVRPRVLDVGCGTGRLLGRFVGAGTTRAVGIDLCPAMLRVAKKNVPALSTWIAADIEEGLPVDRLDVEVVTMTGVLHHLVDPARACARVAAVVSPGTRLLVVDPWFPAPIRALGNAIVHVYPHDGDARYFSPEEATRIVDGSGFEISGVERTSRFGFGVIATRR
jgi:SAM-dependent methyltransferase